MAENQDPFARKTRKKQMPIQELGEVSNTVDNSAEEQEAIKQFIPNAAEVDEGYAKMINIMRQQAIDDARDGRSPNPVVTTDSPFIAKEQPAVITASQTDPVQPILTDVPKAEVKKEDVPKPEIKDEDVLPLLDSILTRGYASDTFTIRGNRVTLRTQFYWEEYEVRAAVESKLSDNSLRLTADNLLQKYVLASCLEQFGGNYFKPLSQGSRSELIDSLESRVEFLDTLPTILVWYLNEKRVAFNDKVLYLSENFDRLIKSF